jgi:hypothetical protein
MDAENLLGLAAGADTVYGRRQIPPLPLTLPPAIFAALYLGPPHERRLELEQVRGQINGKLVQRYGWRLYLPVLCVVILMVAGKLFPGPLNPGLPLICLLLAVVFATRRARPIP